MIAFIWIVVVIAAFFAGWTIGRLEAAYGKRTLVRDAFSHAVKTAKTRKVAPFPHELEGVDDA